MADDIVTTGAKCLSKPDDVVVLARNPSEMAQAQQGLLEWVTEKVAYEQAQLQECETNLAQAQKMKVKTSGWKIQVSKARKRVEYYSKAQSAIQEGYAIVPDFPMDVIAVRTRRKKAPKFGIVKKSTWSMPSTSPVICDRLPEGVGSYVDPSPFREEWVTRGRDAAGKEINIYCASNTELDHEIDFPFTTVRPQVLTDLNKAMQHKIFDQIGVLPATAKGDPMVIGRILMGGTNSVQALNFLITWWIDTRDL